jgi:hypothetical protein
LRRGGGIDADELGNAVAARDVADPTAGTRDLLLRLAVGGRGEEQALEDQA